MNKVALLLTFTLSGYCQAEGLKTVDLKGQEIQSALQLNNNSETAERDPAREKELQDLLKQVRQLNKAVEERNKVLEEMMEDQ